jgi:putative metallopeptidase
VIRPQPSPELQTPGFLIEASLELQEWLMNTFVHEDGELWNAEHEHLQNANIAAIWTNVEFEDGLMPVAGMAEIVRVNGKPWPRAERTDHLCLLHGNVPQARIWIYAPYAVTLDDASFCALVEHELYHLAQKKDKEQQPMFDDDGRPVLTTRAHDVGEFIGVVERYGVGATHSNVKRMVEAAKKKPLVAASSIQLACGTCAAGVGV